LSSGGGPRDQVPTSHVTVKEMIGVPCEHTSNNSAWHYSDVGSVGTFVYGITFKGLRAISLIISSFL